MRQEIKDYTGKILGRIEEEYNGDITARDFYGRIVGTYCKSQDVTKDFYGRIIFNGNMVVSLIELYGNK